MHRLLPFKKKIGKKNVTLDPRHGTLALDIEPSTLDPRQKDILNALGSIPAFGTQSLKVLMRLFKIGREKTIGWYQLRAK